MEFRDSTVRLQARTTFPCAAFALIRRRVLGVLSIEDLVRRDGDLPLRPGT